MSSEQRAGQGVPYGSIANAARAAVRREGCASLKALLPGEGEEAFTLRAQYAQSLRRSPPEEIVEIFPGTFALASVAKEIRAVIARSRRP